jgi:uncharacterized protein (DUF1697 family)
MAIYVSLLRGVNVGGHRKVRMAELTALYASLGFSNVRSYLQSGNLVFESQESDRARLIAMLETEIENRLGYPVTVILRDAGDLQRIYANNPFLTTRSEDPRKFHVMFLAKPPSPTDLDRLTAPENVADEFSVAGLEIYLFYPNGAGRSKLASTFFERNLKVETTTRNWNTITALYNLTNF